MANHVGDTWSIMHCLEPLEYPVKTTFMERYALLSWNARGGMDVVGLRPDTKDEFFQFFDPRYRRTTLALVDPQLPRTIQVVHPVEMSSRQRRTYDELHDDLTAFTPDGELLVAPNALVNATRLMQVAAATVDVEKPDSDDVTTWKIRMREPSWKIDGLEEVLEDLDQFRPLGHVRPVVVFALHVDLIKLAAERLTKRGLTVALATGEQSEYERDLALQALNANRVHALLTTVGASKESLDFSHVDTMIFLQRSWSMIEQTQAQSRNSPARRQDDRRYRAARIVHIITTNTIEDAQVARLLEKSEKLEELNRDRVALARAGRGTSELDRRYAEILGSNLGVPS